jgi:acetylornithine deacetylase/succinyl-diaminopimelate desuccinylase-like protein
MIDVVELTQELVRVDTTNPPGNEAAAIATVHEVLDAAGIYCELVARDPDRPNLIGRIPGRDEAPPLLMQGHVDVVPTTGQRWDHDPFGGAIIDGELWGRGTLDMKGAVAMMTDALVRLAAAPRPPAGDIILCVVADEEHRGDYGARFLVEDHAHHFDGVRYCIGEFGGFPFRLGGTTFYPVQVAERLSVTYELTIRGKGGHGSLPHRGAATARLGSLLTALDRKRMPVHLVPATRLMLDGMIEHTSGATRAALRALHNPLTAEAALRLLPQRLGVMEAVFRNTVTPTVVRGGDKHNVIPAEITVVLDGRMLPGSTPEQMTAELRRIVGDDVVVEYTVDGKPGRANPDLGLLPLLRELLVEQDPEGVPVPFLLPAVTDGRWFAELGIQPYGFTPLQLPHDFRFHELVHAANERVPVRAIRSGADLLAELLVRYGE